MTRAQLEQALQNPNVRAFLTMIAHAEGTTRHGYHTLVGGSRIASLDRHPNQIVDLGRGLRSSAAGRYQFLSRTWKDVATKLDLRDFGERSQDIAAVELLRRRGALPFILQGNFEAAIQASRREWASFPGAGYGQGERSLAFMRRHYENALRALGSAPATGGPVAGGPVAGLVIAATILLLFLRA